ncbi:hypothetical protein DPEC_G00166190 [Dallia pectoralis]|uniref:Uncharacterized protein n=1 Tax=Dallia pectoralis TaxID=75939 RepID=A0ACC2GHR2_DALPE|nr:hypothetical protein DPEC_G00166190 [Dallia pectoralis]
MARRTVAWLLTAFIQVSSVAFAQCSKSEVIGIEVVFGHFPDDQDTDLYMISYRTAHNLTAWLDPIGRAECSANCMLQLWLAEEPEGIDVTLSAILKNVTLETKTFHIVEGLQPGTHYSITAEFTTVLTHLHVSLSQRIHTAVKTAQCPVGWLASERSCYSVSGRSLSWVDALQTCMGSASGGHLVDVKTETDLVLLSHLIAHNYLLLWTALNDRQDEGKHRWSDGSPSNLTSVMTSSRLPANETDCFALQKNATGEGYFLTPFFCHIPLPFICHWEIPVYPPLFTFDLAEVKEREAVLLWSDLTFLNSSHPNPQLCVQYQEERSEEEADQERRAGCIPVSLWSRRLEVPGLSPGKVYSLALRVAHLSGAAWSLGSTHIAHTLPLPPRNVTISNVMANQITVSWKAPDTELGVRCNFLVVWGGVASGQERRIHVSSSSRSTVIRGLEGYRKYTVRVDSVTDFGVESCGGKDFTILTGEQPDGYQVRLSPLNQRHQRDLWVNGSRCVLLGMLDPGQTYEVCVASVRGQNQSQENKVVVSRLAPGEEYHFSIYSTSQQRVGPPYNTNTLKTCPEGVCSRDIFHWVGTGQIVPLLFEDRKRVLHRQSPCDSQHHHRSYRFEDLSPGTYYTVGVIGSNGERRSAPTSVHINTLPGAPLEVLQVKEDWTSSVFVSWGSPAGGVEGYKLLLCRSVEMLSCRTMLVQTNSVQVGGLTPGVDYNITILSLLGSDYSQPINTLFSTRPARVCSLFLSYVNSSCAMVRWDAAIGQFDFHMVTVDNGSHTHTLKVSSEMQVATVTGLKDGCSYNISVKRIRQRVAGAAASLTITTGT